MEKGTRNTVLALAVTSLALAGGASEAADPVPLAVILHVTNHAGTPEPDLARAQAEISQIFGGIGVRTVWSDIAAGPDDRACEGFNVDISLASPHLIRELTRHGAHEDVLGTAPRGGGRIFIYSERVSLRARESMIDERVLLGRVIAHEVGHILLPRKGHSAAGIMVASLNTGPVGAGFTPKEADAIRALLESQAGNRSPRTSCDR